MYLIHICYNLCVCVCVFLRKKNSSWECKSNHEFCILLTLWHVDLTLYKKLHYDAKSEPPYLTTTHVHTKRGRIHLWILPLLQQVIYVGWLHKTLNMWCNNNLEHQWGGHKWWNVGLVLDFVEHELNIYI